MSFIKPGQLVELKNIEFEEKGFVISFHSDFIKGHTLYEEIKKYGFFDYEVNEALHLSPNEEKIMYELYRKIEIEYFNNPDEFSSEIMLAHISSMLKYAQRFYKRQFINRTEASGKILTRFNKVLSEYFESGQIEIKGLPIVNKIAEDLNISPRYMSDLLKVQTGKTAIEHIHIYLINEAKNLLIGSEISISETAYKLGFEYAPYFSRLFKKKVGLSPKEFRKKHCLN
jgi:AraC-like DNA-binding protein